MRRRLVLLIVFLALGAVVSQACVKQPNEGGGGTSTPQSTPTYAGIIMVNATITGPAGGTLVGSAQIFSQYTPNTGVDPFYFPLALSLPATINSNSCASISSLPGGFSSATAESAGADVTLVSGTTQLTLSSLTKAGGPAYAGEASLSAVAPTGGTPKPFFTEFTASLPGAGPVAAQTFTVLLPVAPGGNDFFNNNWTALSSVTLSTTNADLNTVNWTSPPNQVNWQFVVTMEGPAGTGTACHAKNIDQSYMIPLGVVARAPASGTLRLDIVNTQVATLGSGASAPTILLVGMSSQTVPYTHN